MIEFLSNPFLSYQIDKKFEFPRSNLILEETLGEGEFGKVLSARAINLGECSGTENFS